MCIICVKNRGIPCPTKSQLQTMYAHNPHGAGVMYARDGRVYIRKGFMTFCDFWTALKSYNLTSADAVVYHFRISTQAGTGPEMTHPFPLTRIPADCKKLATTCKCGIAHNGIIHLTTDPSNTEYSDTAIFITDYIGWLINSKSDMTDPSILQYIYSLARSKFALMWSDGTISTVGDFITEQNGLLFSNTTYRPYYSAKFTSCNVKSYNSK